MSGKGVYRERERGASWLPLLHIHTWCGKSVYIIQVHCGVSPSSSWSSCRVSFYRRRRRRESRAACYLGSAVYGMGLLWLLTSSSLSPIPCLLHTTRIFYIYQLCLHFLSHLYQILLRLGFLSFCLATGLPTLLLLLYIHLTVIL